MASHTRPFAGYVAGVSEASRGNLVAPNPDHCSLSRLLHSKGASLEVCRPVSEVRKTFTTIWLVAGACTSSPELLSSQSGRFFYHWRSTASATLSAERRSASFRCRSPWRGQTPLVPSPRRVARAVRGVDRTRMTVLRMFGFGTALELAVWIASTMGHEGFAYSREAMSDPTGSLGGYAASGRSRSKRLRG